METLHEHMVATKTVEYIMAAGFLLLFVLFWGFLNAKPRRS